MLTILTSIVVLLLLSLYMCIFISRHSFFADRFGSSSAPLATGVVDLIRHGQGRSINKSPCVKLGEFRCKPA